MEDTFQLGDEVKHKTADFPMVIIVLENSQAKVRYWNKKKESFEEKSFETYELTKMPENKGRPSWLDRKTGLIQNEVSKA